jgi:hypothetical protein
MDFFLGVTYFLEKKWGVGYITSVGIFLLIVLLWSTHFPTLNIVLLTYCSAGAKRILNLIFV